MRNKDLLVATVEFVQDVTNNAFVADSLVPVIKYMNGSKKFKKELAERIANEIDLDLYEAEAAVDDATYIFDEMVEVSKEFVGDDTINLYCSVRVFVDKSYITPIAYDCNRSRIANGDNNAVTFRETFEFKVELDDNDKPDQDSLTLRSH